MAPPLVAGAQKNTPEKNTCRTMYDSYSSKAIVCTYVYIYIYICIYVHVCVYIYTYVYIGNLASRDSGISPRTSSRGFVVSSNLRKTWLAILQGTISSSHHFRFFSKHNRVSKDSVSEGREGNMTFSANLRKTSQNFRNKTRRQMSKSWLAKFPIRRASGSQWGSGGSTGAARSEIPPACIYIMCVYIYIYIYLHIDICIHFVFMLPNRPCGAGGRAARRRVTSRDLCALASEQIHKKVNKHMCCV